MKPSFKTVALKYFSEEVPAGMTQSLNGISVFSSLSEYSFCRLRLRLMWRAGLIRRGRWVSIWASMNGTPTYGPITNRTETGE